MKIEQRQYKFLEASWILMVFTFIGMMVTNAFLVIQMQKAIDVPKNAFTGISMVALILVVPALVSRLVSFSKTTVALNKKEIKVNRSLIIGLPIKSDFLLPYSQIRQYVFQNDQNWNWLKIEDSNGKVYRIWKFAHIKNKEFEDFKDRFTNEIKWYNQDLETTDNPHQQGEQINVAGNIYQGTGGLILGIISLIVIIAIPIIIFVFGMNKVSSLGPFLIGLSGAIFTFFKVLSDRRNKIL